MSESATDTDDIEEGPENFADWQASIGEDSEEDFGDVGEMEWVDEGEEPSWDDPDDLEDEDAATSEEEGSPPAEEEGDDPTPPEGDADDPEEGSEDDAEADAAEDDAEDDDGDEFEEDDELDGEADDGEAAEADAEEPAPGDDQTDPGQAVEWEPFTARADAVDIQLDGALQSDAGIWIPRETWTKQLQPHLADRRVWERERNTLQRKLREKSGAEERADTIVKFFKDDLFKRPVEEQIAWFEDLQQNGPALVAQADAAGERARADSLQAEADQAAQAQAAEDFASEAPRRLRAAVDKALEFEDYKDLGLDADAIYGELAALGVGKLFFRASEDIPELGLREGDIGLDTQLIVNVLDQKAGAAKRAAEREQTQRDAAAATAAAKKKNAGKKRGKKRKRKAPPNVKAGGSPVVAGEEDSEPQSKDEWLRSLRTG